MSLSSFLLGIRRKPLTHHFFQKTLTSGIFSILLLTGWSGIAESAHYHDDVEAYAPWKQGREIGELQMAVTTTSEAARQHFLTGMKLLHTYEFSEATWSFREAQSIDPGFAMAYWGEIIASQIFIWYARDQDQGRIALKRLDQHTNFEQLTELEKGYIDATRALLAGDGVHRPPYEKGSDEWIFRNKMATLYQRFPDNPDLKVFYGYSILGTRRGTFDFDTNQQAITLFQQVLQTQPNHPGALHYLLHATENPVQSYMGEQAAKIIARVTSGSIHTLHMPSHYYMTKGDWQQVIDVNCYAWQASLRRADELGLNEDSLEYHGFGWIIYALLQQGKTEEALKEINILYSLYDRKPTASKQKYLLFASAGFLIDSPTDSTGRKVVRNTSISHDGKISSALAANLFANAYDGWQIDDADRVQKALTDYRKLMTQDITTQSPPDRDAILIMHKLTEGISQLNEENYRSAEAWFKQASTMEDNMVHEHGIPLVVKPANELYGDFLLARHRAGEAQFYYQRALTLQPNRKASLEGMESAWKAINNE
ncbi:hypothetical protein [Endozoicomonas sp.]|uniref:hypothetical protein n=1 Tax=Endozoicomonas sp. TaxID=1892382 RepID=UPI002886F6DC|nr:hypothetical protein [Endozoicomonas sp.]